MLISTLSPAWAGNWSPAKLFGPSDDGFWWDFTAGSHLFRDHLQTLPLTSDGQAIGGVVDKAGKTRHAYQSTSSKRPVWRSAGYAEFDGVDDVLPIQNSMTAYTALTMIVVGHFRSGFTNGGRMFSRSSARAIGGFSGPAFRWTNNEAAASVNLTDSCEVKSLVAAVITSNSVINVWVNNVSRGGSPFDPTDATSTEFQVGASNSAGTTNPALVDVYQAFAISRALSTEERLLVTSFLGRLGGLTL